MATYTVGHEGHYRQGNRYFAGDQIVLDDDEIPSRTFFPVDEAARKAFKKHHPKVNIERNRVEEPKDTAPTTLSEMTRGAAAREAI